MKNKKKNELISNRIYSGAMHLTPKDNTLIHQIFSENNIYGGIYIYKCTTYVYNRLTYLLNFILFHFDIFFSFASKLVLVKYFMYSLYFYHKLS